MGLFTRARGTGDADAAATSSGVTRDEDAAVRKYTFVTLERVLGGILQPLAWALGIPWDEAQLAGSLIGQKFILNEFVAYVTYSEVADQLSAHSQAIVIFALCGFANLSSIAILLGGLGAVAPSRRDDISRYGFRALIAASLSNLMSAALAGFFLTLSGV